MGLTFVGLPTASAEDGTGSDPVAVSTAATESPEAEAEEPKAEPKAEEPEAEPKAEEPEAEEPKAEVKAEEQKSEAPKAEKSEAPRAAEPTAAPEAEESKAEVSKTEPTEEPSPEATASSTPTSEPTETSTPRLTPLKVKLAKKALSVSPTDDPGVWEIRYRITVTNSSATQSGRYDLEDRLIFLDGLAVQSAGVESAPDGVALNPSWTGTGSHLWLAQDVELAAGGEHVYIVRVLGRVTQTALDKGTWECGQNDGGFLNRAKAYDAQTDSPASDYAYACAEPGFPTVEKSDGTATPNEDGSWAVSFRITLSNASNTGLPAILTDSWPVLPAGWSLAGDQWTVAPIDGAPVTNTSSASSPIWSGTLPAKTTYSYLVSATLVPSEEATSIGKCGLVNEATLVSGHLTLTDDDCVSVKLPSVEVEKSDARVRQLADFSWQADYTITVTNTSSTAATHYTLTDTPDLGAGFTGNGDWVGTAPEPGTLIAAGGSHQYTYRVVADYSAVEQPELGCDNHGAFFNTATVVFPGGTDSDSGCGEPAAPQVVKRALPPLFDAETGEWTLTFEVTVTNPSEVELAYTLDDNTAALPAGVTGGSWTAGDASVAGGGTSTRNAAWSGAGLLATGTLPVDAVHTYTVTRTVTVGPGSLPADLVCETGGVRNTVVVSNGIGGNESSDCAELALDDVGITKTHSEVSGEGSVEPDEEFDYILTVTNHGSREATDVVVTDPVPERLDVTGLTLPAGWTNANSPALVDASGQVSVSVPTLAVGASAEIRVHVTVKPLEQGYEEEELDASGLPGAIDGLPDESELLNTACVAAMADSNPDNNCDDDRLDIGESETVLGVEDEEDDDPAEELAMTGSSGSSDVVSIALAAMVTGSLLLWVSRRRRDGEKATG